MVIAQTCVRAVATVWTDIHPVAKYCVDIYPLSRYFVDIYPLSILCGQGTYVRLVGIVWTYVCSVTTERADFASY